MHTRCDTFGALAERRRFRQRAAGLHPSSGFLGADSQRPAGSTPRLTEKKGGGPDDRPEVRGYPAARGKADGPASREQGKLPQHG